MSEAHSLAAKPEPIPDFTELAMPQALADLLERRNLTRKHLGSLLRAEGLTIGRSRLHQICSGQGAAATPEQIERISSVLGVGPGYFAEYRLWRTRSLLDPSAIGFERAMENFNRLRGRRTLGR